MFSLFQVENSLTMSQSSDVILSYYDSLLRQKDIELLEGPCWINDNIIGFYFEYLNMQKVKDSNCSESVLFVSPEVTQLVKLSFDVTYPVFLNPLKAKEKKFVFFPLNDSKSRNQAGGSHWTLLVFSEPEKTFFHLDSANIACQTEVKEFVKSLSKYLLGSNCPTNYIEVQCPQQSNGFDCGIFVMCFADVLLENIVNNSKIENCDYSRVNQLITQKRSDLLELIHQLIELDQSCDAFS